MMDSSQAVYRHFCEGVFLEDRALLLSWAGVHIKLRSNSLTLIDALSDYFSHCLITDIPDIENEGKVLELVAIESELSELHWDFEDWQRELGKRGRKDSYVKLTDGRLLHKVRTGMIFLQSCERLLAVGPCAANSNQVINFINSQLMNHLQQEDYLICHAAAAQVAGAGLALAGFSGGGKSTLMLKLLENPDSKFISNDRLFLKADEEAISAVGVPKMPRVNPGTLLNSPRLRQIMSNDEQAHFEGLEFSKLWDAEYKYDVPVEKFYGKGRVIASSSLQAVVILNWQHESEQPTKLQVVDIVARSELIAAIKKAPGPFYQDRQGSFLPNEISVDETPYLTLLQKTQVWELSGKVDFENAVTLINKQLTVEIPCHA